jgi:hypothetical protein
VLRPRKNGKKGAAADEAAAPASVAAPPAEAPQHVKDGVVETPGAPAEQQPFNPAAWMHERIARQIVDFEKNLDPDHEVGGRFVQGPNNEVLHIENVANWGPDMIVFFGQFPDGRKFELIQHYSQVSVLLVAVRKISDQPRRIGFELMQNIREQPHPWGDPES